MIDIDLLVVHERRTNQRLTDQTITISYDDMTLSNAIADVTHVVYQIHWGKAVSRTYLGFKT